MNLIRGLLIILPPSFAFWFLVFFGTRLGWQTSLIVALSSLAASWVFYEISNAVDDLRDQDDWVAKHKRRIELNASKQRMGIK